MVPQKRKENTVTMEDVPAKKKICLKRIVTPETFLSYFSFIPEDY